ncbi:MAG: cobalamin biosynthesis protein CbiG, partial [Mesorhizobium sp.]
MMVAGIGSRKGVSVEEVLAAIETALEAHGL